MASYPVDVFYGGVLETSHDGLKKIVEKMMGIMTSEVLL